MVWVDGMERKMLGKGNWKREKKGKRRDGKSDKVRNKRIDIPTRSIHIFAH